MKNKALKLTLIIVSAVLAAVILIAGAYAIYVFSAYYRIEDNLFLLSNGEGANNYVKVGKEYKIITYNIGFCAYTPDFGFFMDGGDESRAESAESVKAVADGITKYLNSESPDFIMLEEVDRHATRSHYIDQSALINEAMAGYSSTFICNYDSPYLFYPFLEPHGKSNAGMMLLSKLKTDGALRRSLPVEDGFMKLLDLDRCYAVSRFEVENGRELVLFTVHLSAYTSDGKVTTEQLEMLIADMSAEYDSGNYVVCGGDFNKDLLGNSAEIFGVDGSDQTWAQPFPVEMLEGIGLSLAAPNGKDGPTPSCRNADAPYHDGQFVLTVDGFITSNNVIVKHTEVADLGFEFSDHNPVVMKFELRP